jgi:hypothetical protein
MFAKGSAKGPLAVESDRESDLADSGVVLLQQHAGSFDPAVGQPHDERRSNVLPEGSFTLPLRSGPIDRNRL